MQNGVEVLIQCEPFLQTNGSDFQIKRSGEDGTIFNGKRPAGSIYQNNNGDHIPSKYGDIQETNGLADVTAKLIVEGASWLLPHLKGQHILVIDNVIGESRQQYWCQINQLGIHVHMFLGQPHPILQDSLFSVQILPQLQNQNPEAHCLDIILNYAMKMQSSFAGCLTFNDKMPFLVSLICEQLNKIQPAQNGHSTVSPECNGKSQTSKQLRFMCDPSFATECCQSKEDVYDTLRSSPSTQKFIPDKSTLIESDEDIEAFLKTTTFPVVIKPNSGHSGFGVVCLNSKEDCFEHRHKLQTILHQQISADSRACKDTKIAINEYVNGSYVVVNIVLCKGKLVAGFVCGNGALLQPELIPTTLFWPSGLGNDADREICSAAAQCAMGIGLRNGVYDIEMIRTPQGAIKLIEINPRVTCSTIAYRLWECAGVNLMHAVIGLACSVPLPTALQSDINKRSSKEITESRVMLEYFVNPRRHDLSALSKPTLQKLCQEKHGFAVHVYFDNCDTRCFAISSVGIGAKGPKKNLIQILEAASLITTKTGKSLIPCFDGFLDETS